MVEFRTRLPEHHQGAAYQGAYVETSIPKVSETPLYGRDDGTPETFGPFHGSTRPTMDKNGMKKRTVRFENKDRPTLVPAPVSAPSEEEREDPIEKAFDTFFLFLDDVRQQASSPRADGTTSEGCLYDVPDNLDVNKALECVTDRVCRNPCVEIGCGSVQPPADLVLSTPSKEEREGADHGEPKKQDYMVSKENSVRDLSAPAPTTEPKDDTKAATKNQTPPPPPPPPKTNTKSKVVAATSTAVAVVKDNSITELSDPPAAAPKENKSVPKQQKDVTTKAAPKSAKTASVPTYTPVETIADKLRTVIPEEMLQQMMDAFILETGEIKPDAEALTIKSGVDSDPIVEMIDRLIIFFDDLQVALKTRKMETLMEHYNMEEQMAMARQKIDDILQSYQIKRESSRVAPANKQVQIVAEEQQKKDQGGVEETKDDAFDADRSDMSEDTHKTTNTKIKPPSLQMRPSELLDALQSAATILSDSATPEELSRYSKEELHKLALEKIMSERNEMEEGFSEYKTEEMLLGDLMKTPEEEANDTESPQAEKDASKAEKDASKAERRRKEQLVVLGHSGTLTPIPEADEGSATTPASDILDHGLMSGTAPEVPLIPCEASAGREGSSLADANDSVADDIEQEPDLTKEPTESDPVVKAIDNIFLCVDDMEEQGDIACNACIGSTVPSDLIDPSDDILEGNEEDKEARLKAEKEAEEAAAKAAAVAGGIASSCR
ncbi:expressed unknown protein [Seminavis robusta]|uniref:Uncharacterized protein n=1 Tax=Seminavis robusta TaxID=568900 RepID=A0A9N8EAT5_9STRA|nr:expressed unknown protein [Seminavis robusta]|eukprot:Sro687_g187310.1 n/a (723) ;mRNA; f:49191-51359